MKTLTLIVSLMVAGVAMGRAGTKLSWQGLAPAEQRELKLYWRLPGMMAEERFNRATAAAQKTALTEARKPIDELASRAAADLP
jgi:hypothetical protein